MSLEHGPSSRSVAILRVALKPGRPTSFGTLAGCPVFILPANPLALLVGFEALVRLALRALAGEPEPLRPVIRAVAAHPFDHRAGRAEAVP